MTYSKFKKAYTIAINSLRECDKVADDGYGYSGFAADCINTIVGLEEDFPEYMERFSTESA